MLTLDADFPGGNILLDSIAGDVVSLRQDLRDTNGDWFYWAFRVRGAAGRRLTFRFTAGDVVGARGPAVSVDRGATWRWLGEACVDRAAPASGVSFTHDLPAEADEVFLAFCPTYTRTNLDAFLARQQPGVPLQRTAMCRSRADRAVDLLTMERPAAPFGLLVTARHHACEAMGSYCLEGLLDAALADDAVGRWMRHHVNLAAIPFMDADGVEAGDQGKNRRPYDHNRDYGGPAPADSIYPEVATIRRWAPEWLAHHKTNFVFDLHCPWKSGGINEQVYFVGNSNARVWRNLTAFSHAMEQHRTGPLPYREANNLPFGVDWNTLTGDKIGGRSCSNWASDQPNVHVGVSVEVPYANAQGTEVTPDTARALGRDLVRALHRYAEQME